MDGLSVVGLGSHLPHEPIPSETMPALTGLPPLLREEAARRAPATRHHVRHGERAADLIEAAAAPLFAARGATAAEEVDVVLTNVLLPDDMFTGCGAEVVDRLGITPTWVLDVHNTGCASFSYMLGLAERLMTEGARGALIANVQNTAGQMFRQPTIEPTPAALMPGDGAGVALLTRDGPGARVVASRSRHTPGAAARIGLQAGGRRYWEAGTGDLMVWFDEERSRETIALGNTLVPELVEGVCADLGIATTEIDLLVTNQPNRTFLAHWSERLSPKIHFDTFDRFGNLYGAGVPISLHVAAREGLIRADGVVVVAGFAHAGDFASASALHWEHPPTAV